MTSSAGERGIYTRRTRISGRPFPIPGQPGIELDNKIQSTRTSARPWHPYGRGEAAGLRNVAVAKFVTVPLIAVELPVPPNGFPRPAQSFAVLRRAGNWQQAIESARRPAPEKPAKIKICCSFQGNASNRRRTRFRIA